MHTETERLRAVTDTLRVRMLRVLILAGEPLCVCELVDILRRPQYAVSRALSALRSSGLVEEERRGRLKFYRLHNDPFNRKLFDCLAAVPTGDPTIRQLDTAEIYAEATDFLETIPKGANLVIDPIDAFERTERGQYRTFMNGLLEHVRETQTVAFVHCLDSEEPPSLRPLTIHFSDLVFEFDASMSVAGIVCVVVPTPRSASDVPIPTNRVAAPVDDR